MVVMEFETLLVELKGKVAIVTINRPDKLNALNSVVMREIGDFFSKVATADNIEAVVFTGAGEKSFVAGADIAEINTLSPTEAAHFARYGQQIFTKIERFPKLCIAAVNGFALGGGCELAMSFHVRFASENAKFGQPEVKLGIIPGYGGTQRLPRLVGKGRALELLLSGDIITADEAFRIGLVNKIYPLSELLDKAVEFANRCLANAPMALSYTICAVNQGVESPIYEALANEAHLFGLSVATGDFKEGTSAFLEKRKPEFKGN
jgi:enoyl-CoA hydratase